MARYEHLPIYRDAYDLALYLEKLIKGFSRYHKYVTGADLRGRTRFVIEKIIEANNAVNKKKPLLELRQGIELLGVMLRLSHDAGAFPSVKSYMYVAEKVAVLARQNEGWLRKQR